MDYTSALVRLLSILNLLHKKRQLNHCNIHPENILVEVQHHHDQLQQEQQPQAGGEKPTGRRTLNFILVDFTPPIILEPLILKLKSEIVAPPLWIAPELIKDILDAPSPLQWTSYHTAVDFHKIDIYALGWTMASLITRIFPSRCLTDFCHIHDTGRMMMDALKEDLRHLEEFKDQKGRAELISMIQRMTEADPCLRPSAEELLGGRDGLTEEPMSTIDKVMSWLFDDDDTSDETYSS
eukprot:GHVH01011556.1.p1 GENE.GHVH01011556.1~~GHVH01011556.1.p1  ORF type:complete len:238 (+),score=40.62 GHVH01011556.1:865-1578(+)